MEQRNYKLYVHIIPDGRRYYGITKCKYLSNRWQKGEGYKNQPRFSEAIAQYGWNNIEQIILFNDLTEEEARELEHYFIQWYNTTNKNYGCNRNH